MAGNGPSSAASEAADTQFPHPDTSSKSIERKGFKITTRKLPILKAGPIDDMTNRLTFAPPEMIFGDNYVAIEHQPSGWAINFNAFDALDRVDKTGKAMLQVAHSKEWHKSRENTHQGIKHVAKPFDWSFTTDYSGTVSPGSKQFESSTTPVPFELLKRPDPILFFDEVMLYEDELADNGIAMLSCKIRVMPSRLLLLSRFFMRLDNVLLRLRDTRVYVDFDTGEVIRQYLAKEEQYDKIREVLSRKREDVPATMRDPNKLSDILPVVDERLEKVTLGG